MAVYASYLEDFVASRGALQPAWKGWLEYRAAGVSALAEQFAELSRKSFPKAVSVIEAGIH